MQTSARMRAGRTLAFTAVFAGVCAYWIVQAQQSSDDAARFTGASRSLEAEGWRLSHRWFEASARTAWHRHPGGQLLFVEGGQARVQERGGTLLQLATGESHYTGPNVEHWHGATPNGEFRQVALGRGAADETVWLEKVSDDQYAGR